jgi:hypothetical protein
MIPLGIFGAIAFLWFLVASIKTLYRFYAHGDPALRTINSYLLAAFIAHTIQFMFVFGAFYLDLFIFTGLAGIAVSLNGVQKFEPVTVSDEEETANDFPELVGSRSRFF